MEIRHCSKHPDRLIMPSRLRRFPGATTGCPLCSKESRARGRKRRAVKFDSGAVRCKNHPRKKASRSFYLATGARLCAACLAHNADGSRKARRQPEWQLIVRPTTSLAPTVQEPDGDLSFLDESSLTRLRVKATSPRGAREGVREAVKLVSFNRLLHGKIPESSFRVAGPNGAVSTDLTVQGLMLALLLQGCNEAGIAIVEPAPEDLQPPEKPPKEEVVTREVPTGSAEPK